MWFVHLSEPTHVLSGMGGRSLTWSGLCAEMWSEYSCSSPVLQVFSHTSVEEFHRIGRLYM